MLNIQKTNYVFFYNIFLDFNNLKKNYNNSTLRNFSHKIMIFFQFSKKDFIIKSNNRS